MSPAEALLLLAFGWMAVSAVRYPRRRRRGFGVTGRRRHSYRYDWYIRSPVWRFRRRVWFATSLRRCSRCHCRLAIRGGEGLPVAQFHHLRYDHLMFERRGRDIVMVCPACHPVLDRQRRTGKGR